MYSLKFIIALLVSFNVLIDAKDRNKERTGKCRCNDGVDNYLDILQKKIKLFIYHFKNISSVFTF